MKPYFLFSDLKFQEVLLSTRAGQFAATHALIYLNIQVLYLKQNRDHQRALSWHCICDSIFSSSTQGVCMCREASLLCAVYSIDAKSGLHVGGKLNQT